MSILIRDMKMPENCGECRFMVDGWCYGMNEDYGGRQDSMIRKPDWCPLEEGPTQETRSNTLDALDCISRQAAIDAADRADYTGLAIEDVKRITDEVVKEIKQLPSAQPTLYGYNIEHLAYIARVMEKEGITAEVAVNTFLDVGHAVKMILDEARETAEREIFK